MGDQSSTTGKTEQTSQLTGYAPAMAGIDGILGKLGSSIDNINGTPQINQAFGQLAANAQAPNPYADPTRSAALSQLAGGANYGNATGILNNAYGKAASALQPYASGDPYSSPALAQMRATDAQDVANTVNPMFAAAGRLGSPDNYQALARGITQGESSILGQAAQNQIQAGGMLGSLGTSIASGLSGADAANAGIQGQGIGNAATAYGIPNLGPQALLAAATGQQQLPMQNAATLAGILGPLAAQFGKQTSTGNSTTTQDPSMLSDIYGGMNAVANLVKAFKSGPGQS